MFAWSKIAAACAAWVLVATTARAQEGGIVESVTDSGMRIWSFPDEIGDRFVIAVVVGVGSRDEGAEVPGIAHFLEHVLFGRTAVRPKAAADSELRRLGATYNGFTSHEVTAYHMAVNADDWQFAVDWLADHVAAPAFADEDVDAERRIVREEIDTRDDHAGAVTFETLLYPGHALGKSVGGDSSGFDSIDRAALERFHRAHYRAGNIAVGFAGRIDRDDCARAVRAAFAALPYGDGAAIVDLVRPRTGQMVPTMGRNPDRTGWLVAGFHLPASSARELALGHVLGAYLHQRFFDEVREARQLAYAPGVEALPHRDTLRLQFDVEVGDQRNLATVVEVIDQLIAELQSVDTDQLATARGRALRPMRATGGRQLADAMTLGWLLQRCGSSPQDFVWAAASATPGEIAAFARGHLTSSSRYVVSSVAIDHGFTLWAGLVMLAFVLLLVDGFGSFARTRALAGWAGSVWRRPRGSVSKGSVPKGSVSKGSVSKGRARKGKMLSMPKRPVEKPIVPVAGEEIEKSIQRYFEDEEGKP